MKVFKPNSGIYILIFCFFIINIIQAVLTPVIDDEAYYWLWAQQPDWGYFDHPPMIAIWIAAGIKLFKGTLGLRFFTVVFNTLSIFLIWKILKPKNKNQLILFSILIFSFLVLQSFGFIATPDAPLLFFSFLYLLSLKYFLKKNSLSSALILGFAMAGLMYSKYHGLLLIIFSLLPLVFKLIKNPKFYISVVFSLILFIPHLLWLFKHDFIPFEYHLTDRSANDGFKFNQLALFPVYYFLGMAPFLFYFNFKSLIKFKPKSEFDKSLYSVSILPGIFFFITLFKGNVQPQWLLICFVAMVLIFYKFYANQKISKGMITTGIAGIILILAARIYLMLPGFSVFEINKKFGEDLAAFNIDNAVFEKYQEASVYSFYNPGKNVFVHRTLGNRKSQFDIWYKNQDFNGKNITYISPWVKGKDSIRAYKNMIYSLKEIENYTSFHKIEIQTVKNLRLKATEKTKLKIKIINAENHLVTIGENSEFILNLNYYKGKSHEILYTYIVELENLTLIPGEVKELEIEIKNISEKGNFKAAFGLNYLPLGTVYLSEPIEIISN